MQGKNYLAVQQSRITACRGVRRAQVAVAHSILVTAYHMLKRREPYLDLGPEWLTIRNEEARTLRPVKQLEKLGHTVTIDPAARRVTGNFIAGLHLTGLPRALVRLFTGVCGC